MQAGSCRVQPQDSDYLPASTPNRPLPLHVQDGEMLRRQFYFALAVHERAVQLRSLSETVAAEKRLLLTSARRGALARTCRQSYQSEWSPVGPICALTYLAHSANFPLPPRAQNWGRQNRVVLKKMFCSHLRTILTAV